MAASSLPRKAVEAAALLATGMHIKDIAAQLEVTPSKVSGWIKREDFQQHYRQILQSAGLRQYAKAINVLENQLDSKSEWIAQGAARDLANRVEKAVAGIDSNKITVTLAGMPELGTPDNEESEE